MVVIVGQKRTEFSDSHGGVVVVRRRRRVVGEGDRCGGVRRGCEGGEGSGGVEVGGREGETGRFGWRLWHDTIR